MHIEVREAMPDCWQVRIKHDTGYVTSIHCSFPTELEAIKCGREVMGRYKKAEPKPEKVYPTLWRVVKSQEELIDEIIEKGQAR